MSLNKSRGNMYPWVSHTWNVIKGKCPHDCSYCYMKRYPQPELHFDEKELKTELGNNRIIFVGSSCDMWADNIPDLWIARILYWCRNFDNKYLFQTKNPARYLHGMEPLMGLAEWAFPSCILGTTIESNRCCCDLTPKAPCTSQRYLAMRKIPFPKMVSIEPIMDFDLEDFVMMIREIKPEFVSIGADSGDNHLPEPSGDKVKEFIEGLREFTEVKVKDNLKRMVDTPIT